MLGWTRLKDDVTIDSPVAQVLPEKQTISAPCIPWVALSELPDSVLLAEFSQLFSALLEQIVLSEKTKVDKSVRKVIGPLSKKR